MASIKTVDNGAVKLLEVQAVSVGTVEITLRATDPSGEWAEDKFNITVIDGSGLPHLSSFNDVTLSVNNGGTEYINPPLPAVASAGSTTFFAPNALTAVSANPSVATVEIINWQNGAPDDKSFVTFNLRVTAVGTGVTTVSVTNAPNFATAVTETFTVTVTGNLAPAQPTNLQATPGDGEVALIWNNPSDSSITKYQVRYAQGTADPTTATWNDITGSGAATTSHTVDNLTNGTTYAFQVRAVSAQGDGATSDTVTATPLAKPAAPTGLTAAARDRAALLTWTDPSNTSISKYQVRHAAGTSVPANTAWTDIAGSTATTISHTVDNLTNGTQYAFELRAVNASGDGAAATATATPAQPTVTLALSATAISENGGQATVTASLDYPSTGATTLTVAVAPATGSTAVPGDFTLSSPPTLMIAQGDTTSTGTVTVTGVDNTEDTADKDLTVSATAANPQGVTGPASLTLTLTDDDAPPAAPTGLTATAGDTQVTLNWTDPSNNAITKYQVRYGAGSTVPATATWEDITGSGATTTTHTVDNLTNGTQYAFEIRAVNVTGNSDASATVTATPTLAIPDAPTGLTATAGNAQVTLTWTNPTNASTLTNIQVRYKATADLPFNDNTDTWTDLAATATTYTATSLTNGTGYTFEVRATNTAGSSTAATATATPRAPAPARTLTFTFSDDGTTITIAASGSLDVSGFNYVLDTTPQAEGYRGLLIDDTEIWQIMPQLGTTPLSWYDSLPNFVTTGTSTYTGNAQIETLSNYSHDFAIYFDTNFKWLYIDKANLTGNIYDLTGKNVTFTGTLSGTLGDNDFHIEHAIGTQKIIFTTTTATVPAAPTGLTATAGDTQVTLNWTDPNDDTITKYQVRYGAGSTVPATATWDDITGSGATTTTHTVDNLTNGTQYAFEIRAVNVTGNSDASATVTATPALAIPDAPTGLTATAGNAQVTLTWTNPTNASTITNIQVRYKATADLPFNDNTDTWTDLAATATTYTATGLTNGTGYTFAVRATNTAGNSTAATATATPTLPVPDAPTGLSAAAGDTQVTLNWTDPQNTSITKYQVRYGAGSTVPATANWEDITGSVATTISHDVTGLTNGTEYAFEIRAVNATGNSDASATVTATPTAPTPARTLTFTFSDDGTTITIAASGSLDVSGFNFVRDATPQGEGFRGLHIDDTDISQIMPQLGSTSLSFYDSLPNFVTTGTSTYTGNREIQTLSNYTHDFAVNFDTRLKWLYIDKANLSGNIYDLTGDEVTFTGTLSGTLGDNDFHIEHTFGTQKIIFTTTTATVPAAPTGLTAVAGDTQVTLNWTDPNDDTITKYQVRYGAGSTVPATATWGDITGSGATTTSHIVTGLTNATQYAFEIRAVNATGNSDASATVTATPTLAIPDAPTGLTATAGNAQVTLTWTNPTNASTLTSIQVRYKATADLPFNDNTDTWTDLAATATTYTATSLTNGTGYTFAVRATNTAGNSTAATATATPTLPAPAAPTGLSAAAGDTQVTLNWTDPQNTSITKYQVRYGAGSTVPATATWEDITGSGATTISHDVTGLTNGTQYAFEIRAVNATGNSDASATVTATPTAPTPARTLTYTFTDDGSTVTIAASGSLDVSGFNFVMDTTPSMRGYRGISIDDTGIWQIMPQLDSTPLSYYDSLPDIVTTGKDTYTGSGAIEFLSNYTHDFAIRFIPFYKWLFIDKANISGNIYDPTGDEVTFTGTLSGTLGDNDFHIEHTFGNQKIIFTATPPPVPVAPTNLSATAGDTEATLNWANPNDSSITKYQFRQAQGATVPDSTAWADITGSGAGTTSHTVTGLTNGQQYAFQIRAVNNGGNSDASDTATATPRVDTTPSFGTETIDDQNYTRNTAIATLTLPEATGGNGTLTYSLNPAAPAGLAFDAANRTLTGTPTAVQSETAYTYTVTDADGDTASLTFNITIAEAVEPPASPSNLIAIAGDTRVTLAWIDPNDPTITGYEVLYQYGSDPWEPIEGSDATTTRHTVENLVNGTEYTFQIRAVAGNVPGDPSIAVKATPQVAVPDAPDNLTATAGDRSVSLSWDLPTNASVLDKVQVRHQARGETTWEPWTDLAADATTHTLTNLKNGQDYLFEVRAESASGAGPAARTAARPELAVPGKPTEFSATGGNTEVALGWKLPTNTSEIDTVQVRWKATADLPFDDARDAWTDLPSADATAYTATGLTNGTGYTFEVRATNKAGNGEPASGAATPRAPPLVTPGAPTKLSTVPGDTEVVVLWTLPTNTSQIDSVELRYKVKTAPDTDWSKWNSLAGTAERYRVTGLVNGTDYLFEVRAVNTAGTGPSASVEGTPELAKPSAPSNLQASAGDTQVTLTWDLPDKGTVDTIDVRHKKKTDTAWSQWTLLAKDATTHTETGLDNGVTYEFEVRASNTAGSSDSVAVDAQPKLAVPDAPTNLTATAGDGKVGLTWDLPTNTSEIDRMQVAYKVKSAANFQPWVDLAKDATSHEVTGLTNGTEYTFIVRALNGAGRGAVAEVDATPVAVPTAPTGLAAAPGDTQVVLSWTLPANAGALTKVQVRHKADTAKSWQAWVDLAANATTHTVTGLTNGQLYNFEVRAENASGAGAAASVSATPVPPLVAPGAPTNLSTVPGDTEVVVLWTLPTNTNQIDRVELRHKVKAAPDTGWSNWRSLAGTAERERVTGLVNGTDYLFEVRAVNTAGTGPSASVEGTPELAKPSAPSNLQAAGGDTQVTLTWDLPDKGAVIDSIDVRYKKKTDNWADDWTALAADATTYTVTGLDNGVVYEFQVRATNTAGSSASVDTTAQPKLAVPDAPTNLTATAGNAQVILNWTLPTNASVIGDVQVRWKATADLPFNDTTDTWTDLNDGTATTYTATGLTNGTGYTFAVRATNTAGNGEAATVSATSNALPTFGAQTIADQTYMQNSAIATLNLPQASGGDGTLTYTLTPTPPAGLTFSDTARTLTGTPTTAQSATAYTYTATDADGDTASLTFNITVTADTQAPRVASIVRHDPPTSPTNAVSLTWRVTFSEAVVNVSDDDFHVAGTDGTETATAVGTDGTTWDVNVAGGNMVVLAGTVNLEFVQGQDIEDTAGNALTDTTPTGTNDDTYLLDRTPPHVTSIFRYDSETGNTDAKSPTNRDSVQWSVQYNESMRNSGAGSAAAYTVTFVPAITQEPTLTVTPGADDPNTCGDLTPYVVNISGGALADYNGTATLTLNHAEVTDCVGNTLRDRTPPRGNQITYELDNTAPTVAITGVSGTVNAAVDATFTFSESVTGFEAGDITLTNADASAFAQPDPAAPVYTAKITPKAAGEFSVAVAAAVAQDAAGNDNAAATTVTATYEELEPPAKPRSLVAIAGDTEVTLIWANPGDDSITKYQIFNSETVGINLWDDIPGSGADTVTHTVTGLTNGTEYTFQIRAVAGSLLGDASDAVKATPQVAVPDAPDNLTATAGDRSVSLTWDLPTNASVLDKVQVRHQARGETTWEPWTDLAADATTHTVANLKNGQDYLFEVRAESASGAGPAARTAGTPELAVPGKPTEFSATAGDTEVALSWKLPTNTSEIDTVQVRWKATADLPFDDARDAWTDLPSADATAYTATGLTNGTGYTFEVRATNTAGNGEPASGAATPRAPPLVTPGAPTNLSTVPGDTEVVVLWTLPTNTSRIDSVELRHKVKTAPDTGWSAWSSLAGTAERSRVTGLTNGTDYLFEVRAVNTVGTGPSASVEGTPELAKPSAPSNLQAAAGDTQVTLTWDLPDKGTVDTIDVRHKKKTDTAWSQWTLLAKDATTHTETGLDNGVTYEFEVRATNTAGSSDSVAVDAQPKLAVPDAPTNLTATAGDGSVSLTWDLPTNTSEIDRMQVAYKVKSAANFQPWVDLAKDATSHEVTGLTNGTEYTFIVRALNGAGRGAVAEVDATPVAVPTAPTGLAAAPGDTQVVLSWTLPANAGALTKVQVRHKADTAKDWEAWVDLTANATTHTVTGLTNGELYNFEVRAENASGPGAAASVSATPVPPLVAPGAPTNLSTVPGDTEVVVLWTLPTNTRQIDSVELRHKVKAAPDTGWSNWRSLAGTAERERVTGLVNGTDYLFEVRAVNTAGTGPSASVEGTPQLAKPSSPSNLQASAGDTQVTLTWDLPDKGTVDSIDVRHKKKTDTSWSQWTLLAKDATTSTVTGLDNGVTYEFEVRATNAAGSSDSVDATAQPKLAVPEAPTSLTATGGNTQVELSWTLPTNASVIGAVQVRWKATADLPFTASDAWTDLVGTATAYTATGLTNGTGYTFEVRATNTAGDGPAATASATPMAPTQARTLTLTFSDDGSTVTIDAAGSLDFSASGSRPDSTIGIENAIYFDDTDIWAIGSDSSGVNSLMGSYQLSDLTTTVNEPFSGSTTAENLPNYSAEFFLRFTTFHNRMRVDPDNLTGTIYDPTGDKVTFTGTLQSTLGDNDFDIEHAFGNQKIIFKTASPATIPAAPTGLAATAGNAQVDLAWTNPNDSNIIRYQVRYGAGSTVPATATWANIGNSGAGTTTHTVAGLTNDTEYAFEIRAVNARGNSAASATVTATPAPPVPVAPTGLTATAGDTEVTLNWTNPSDISITKYQVSYESLDAGSNSATWEDIPNSDDTSTTHTVTGLTNGTAYAFRLRAVNATGEGPASAAVTATPTLAIPGAPTDLSATAGDKQARLNWTLPTNASVIAKVEMRYKPTADLPFNDSTDTWTNLNDATATTTTVTGLTNGTNYTFAVRATNTAGDGEAATTTAIPRAPPALVVSTTTLDVQPGASETFTVALAAAPTAPVTVTLTSDDTDVTVSPTPLTFTATNYSTTQKVTVNMAANPTDGAATVTLTAAGGNYAGLTATVAVTANALPSFGDKTIADQDYTQNTAIPTLNLPEAGGGDTPLTYTLTPTPPAGLTFDATARTLTGAPTGTQAATEYTYTATDANGDTAELTFDIRIAATLTIGGVADADQPENATYTGNATLTGAPVGDITWALRGADTRRQGGFTLSNQTNTGATVTLAAKDHESPTDDDTNNIYEYALTATDEDGNSAMVEVAITITDVDEPPAKPSNFNARAGDTRVTLTWNDPRDRSITKYQVTDHTGVGYDSWVDILNSGATTTSHTVENLTNGTEYTFQVRAVVGTAAGPPSDERKAIPELAVPDAPTDLTATPGDTRVTLNWVLPTNASELDKVQVRYRRLTETTWSAWVDLAADATEHTVTNLKNGQTYQFAVRAVNTAGEGEARITARPVLAIPGEPTDLTAAPGDQQVALTWVLPTNTSEIDWVDVAYKEKSATNYRPWVTLKDEDATTYTVMGLTNGTEYTFIVRARNDAGRGEVASVDATPLAVPTAPTGLAATPGDTQVGLSWTLPTDSGVLTKMQARHKADTAKQWQAWVDLAADATTHTVTGLTNGQLYNFEVRAENASGAGAAASISATPAPPLVTPGAPTNLSTVPGDTEVVVLWTLPTNTSRIDSVELRYKVKTAPDTGWSEWRSLAGTAERERVTGLVNGTDYLFEVRAVNTAGTGPSASVEGTPELAKPSAPSNLQAAAGDTQVTLTWDLPDKGTVDTIDVRHKKKTDTAWSQWTLLAKDATTHTETGLDNGVTYEFEVRATNTAGSSDSVAVDAQPKLAVPDAPGNLTAAPGDGKVGLTWDLPTNTSEIDRMQVAYKVKSATNFQPWVDLAKDATSHEVTGLTNGTEYTFIVRALNGAGRGAVAEVDATPVAVPSAPTGLTATVGDGQVALSWTLPTGVLTSVQVRYKADTAKDWQAWVDLAANATTYTVTGLTNGQLYNFEVRAENASGAGASAAISATPTTAPGAPTKLSTVPGDTEVVVLWTLPTNTNQIDRVELRYKVKTAPDTGWSEWRSLAGTAEREWVTGLTNGTDYLFEVRAVNAVGTGPSASVEGTPELAKPSAPSNLQASAGDTQVTLTWDLPDKGAVIDSIDVRYKKKTDNWADDWTALAADATTYTVTGLDNGVVYEFQVRATNTAGSSASVDTTAQPKLAVPDAPTNLTASAGNAQVTLNWTLPTNASVIGDVQVRWKATADLPFTATDTWTNLNDGTATTYTATGLTNGTGYTFAVRATNTAGNGEAATAAATPTAPTPARTLTFTFSDDGATTTIAASGSLDMSGYTDVGDTVPQHVIYIKIDDTDELWAFHPASLSNGAPSRRYEDLPDFTKTGRSSFTGYTEILNLANYSNDFTILFNTYRKYMVVDKASLNGDIYNPTGKNVTFSGTVLDTIGDNDFHIELAIGNQKIVYTATPPPVPAAPTGLSAAPGDTEVTLNWANPNDSSITKYQFRQAQGQTVPGSTAWTDITGSGAGTTSHTVTGLINGQQYAFQIRAVNNGGNSDASDTVTATPRVDTTPSFGTETIDDQNYTRNTAIATLTLPEATGGNGTLTYSLTPAAPAGLNFDATNRTLTGTPSAVQDATQYTYTATDADGDTASLKFNITITEPPERPAKPRNFTAIAGDTEVTLILGRSQGR